MAMVIGEVDNIFKSDFFWLVIVTQSKIQAPEDKKMRIKISTLTSNPFCFLNDCRMTIWELQLKLKC